MPTGVRSAFDEDLTESVTTRSSHVSGSSAGAGASSAADISPPFSFQDIRLPWLGLAAWLVAVCWPSLKLYERLTLHDVPRLACALPSRAGCPDIAPGRLVGRLGWLALTLGGGAAVIGIGLRSVLVETFLAAFVINA